MSAEQTNYIRVLADRWAAHERNRVAFLDDYPAPLDDHEREALLGWVRRELERETDRRCARRCKSLDLGPDWSGRVDWDSDRLALAYHVGQTLGGALEDPNLAVHLCAAAADRFGGWPS